MFFLRFLRLPFFHLLLVQSRVVHIKIFPTIFDISLIILIVRKKFKKVAANREIYWSKIVLQAAR